mgnify:FL=1|jgi:transfer complex protein
MFLGKKRNDGKKQEPNNKPSGRPDVGHDRKRSKRRNGKTKKKSRLTRRAQEFLWYESMLESGVCVLGGGLYSACLKLSDINYQMATDEQQHSILESYAQLFNKFGSGEHLAVTIMNRRVERRSLVGRVLFPEPRYGDEFTALRSDHNRIVHASIGDRKYVIVTEKYLTLTVKASDLEEAKARLDRLVTLVAKHMLGLLQCRAEQLDGVGRIELLREWTRGCYAKGFDYAAMDLSGATTHDELAPQAVELGDRSRLVLVGDEGELHYQVLVMRDYPTWVADTLFTRLSEVQTDLAITFVVEPIDKVEGKQLVRTYRAGLSMERQDARRRALKADMDPEYDLPERVINGMEEVRDLQQAMDQQDQRLFTTTLVVMVRAESKEELAKRVDQVRKAAKGESCELSFLKFWQEEGFNTALPLGLSLVPFHRTLTTASVAVMMPFVSQEILDDQGLFYGINSTTRNPIIMDRRATRNGNAFNLGTSGSGKSYFTKWEIVEVLLGRPKDVIIIMDPEREYRALVEALGGTVIDIHAGSTHSINLFDLVLSNVEGDPIRLKTEAVLGMLQVLLGGNTGIDAAAKSLLDRCITALYRRWAETPPERQEMPTLQDLYHEVRGQGDEIAAQVAAALEIYAVGSYSGFARQTNVDTKHRLVCYDTSQLGPSLQTFGMMVVLDSIWNTVQRNYGSGIRSWLYMDEFSLLLANEHATQQVTQFYQRFRKYGGLPTAMLQNITALLENPSACRMLNNAEVLFLMGQSHTDADALAELLGLSEDEIRAFTAVEPGCGLLRVGATTIPFNGRKPHDGPLNVLFSTTFEETGTEAGRGQ